MSSRLLGRGWPPEHPRAVRAEGRHVWDSDGNRYLDGASAGLAATLGYNVPEIAEAVAAQLRSLSTAHSLAFTTEVAETLAAELAARLPGDLGRSLFVTGGTEAIEMAMLAAHRIQAARGEPRRRVFIGRHLSYHGASLTTLALGGRVGLRRHVEPLLTSMPHVPPPYPYRPEWSERFPEAVSGVPGVADLLAGTPDDSFEGALGPDEVERGRADPAEALAVAIEALGPENVCAFVAEPVIGASAGAVVPDHGYWPRVREICDRHGVLWIADEVMTGMGRTGDWTASARFDVVPDVVAFGKGIAAAHQPLGATVVREAHWESLASGPPGFPYGFTFAQHPVTVAAGLATLRAIESGDLLARCMALGTHLVAQLQERLADHPHVGEVRGAGLLIGVELAADRESRSPFPAEADVTTRLLDRAREAGLLLYPAGGGADGVAGDAFLVAPALTTTDAEADELVDGVVSTIRQELPPDGSRRQAEAHRA